MKLETLLAQAGSSWDSTTGSVSTPIYQVAAFQHPALGQSTGFDYSRTANPTRSVLENTFCRLEGGARAVAFSSGLAALDAILRLLKPGEKVLASEDPYGGSVRLLDVVHAATGIETVYVNTADTGAVAEAMQRDRFAAILIEVPTNPLLRVADVKAISALARNQGALVIVDNTFLTPLRFRAFEHGADVTIYSATKYLSGHNDVVSGLAVAKDAALGERLAFIQNAAGAILGPMDCWLVLRGLKTLSVRLERQEANALRVAEALRDHPRVSRVYYPGLADDPGHARLKAQADGFGAMIAFEVSDAAMVPAVLENTEVFLFAESLGGTESLITFPVRQTHMDIPEAARERLGINDRLLRLSIGLEDAGDLVEDLCRALDRA